MKNSARTLTLAGALALVIALPVGAFAAEAQTPPAKESVKAETKAKKAEPKCEPSTASRLRKDEKDCGKDSQQTRSYSKSELESTGQTNTAEALRRLDPRVH